MSNEKNPGSNEPWTGTQHLARDLNWVLKHREHAANGENTFQITFMKKEGSTIYPPLDSRKSAMKSEVAQKELIELCDDIKKMVATRMEIIAETLMLNLAEITVGKVEEDTIVSP